MVNVKEVEVWDTVYYDSDACYRRMEYMLAPHLCQFNLTIPAIVDVFFAQIGDWLDNQERVRGVGTEIT